MNQYLHPGGIVIVPAWVAAQLESALPIDEYRQSEQLVNRKLYEVLEALHLAAVTYRSSAGTNMAEPRNVNKESKHMEVAEAADRAKVSAEYLRRELREGRLVGRKADDNSRWLVTETDFLQWQVGRRTRLKLRS